MWATIAPSTFSLEKEPFECEVTRVGHTTLILDYTKANETIRVLNFSIREWVIIEGKPLVFTRPNQTIGSTTTC